MGNYYVSPTGSGNQSGSDWANAAAFNVVSKIAAKAGTGGHVYLAANLGTYNVSSSVAIGQAGVTIQGMNTDGTAGSATFEGSRAHNWSVGGATGNELFRVCADGVTLQNMQVNDTGTAVRVTNDVKNLTVDHVNASNVQYYLNDYASSGTASISGLTISNAAIAGFSKAAIDVRYNSSNVLIDNVTGDSQGQIGDNFAQGVHLEGTTHDATIQNVTMANAKAVGTSSTYWEGDGFSTESGTYNVTFKNTTARGNTDGGYDLKSSNLSLIDTVADGNGRNYRFWGKNVTVNGAVGLDPHKMGGISTQSQVWIAAGAQVAIDNSAFSDSGSGTKAIYNDGGALTFSNSTLSMASNAIAFFGQPGPYAGLTMSQVAATGVFSLGSEVAPAAPFHTIQVEGAGQTFAGTDAIDLFVFDNTGKKTGLDTIDAFHGNDLAVTSQKIADQGNDGLIQLSDHRIFDFGDGLKISITGMSANGLRYLGHGTAGYLYGDAAERPAGAQEGLVGTDDTLSGLAKDRKTESFFFDTGIDQNLGHDKVQNFGALDVILTSTQIGSGAKGSIVNSVNGAFALSHDGLDLGSISVSDTSGHAVGTLEYDGAMTANGHQYYVYSSVGAAVGAAMGV